MLQDRVAAAARAGVRTPALVGDDATFTYGELADFALRVASKLRECGCGRGDRVAVFMPHSARAVATAVGVLEAGCVCVPLDSAGRLVSAAQALRSAEAKALLAGGCDPALLDNLESRGALRGTAVGWLGPSGRPKQAGFSLDDIAMASPRRFHQASKSSDLAFILFDLEVASGVPPGIVLTHDNVRGLADWAVEAFELGDRDRLSGLNRPGLDLSLFDAHVTFAAGAQLHIAPERFLADPKELARFAVDRSLTLWLSGPSTLSMVARCDAFADRAPRALRHVLWRGEALPPADLAYWREHLPGATFTSLYGAPETTVACAYHRISADGTGAAGRWPIGAAREGEELLVIDDELGELSPGRVGEIYVRGSGVSPGYWRDRERTPDAFPSAPDISSRARVYRTGDRGTLDPDGLFRLAGRAGFGLEGLAEPRGHGSERVSDAALPAGTDGSASPEPADVEQALLELEEVAACAVVPVRAGATGSVLGCAYVPSNGRTLRTRDLASRLAGRLPEHAIPSRWLVLDELPMDRWGRVDRALARTLLGG